MTCSNDDDWRELCNEYALICLPMFLLSLIKLYAGDWQQIFLATDWSIASIIIFSISIGQVPQAVANCSGKKCRIKKHGMTSFVILTVILGLIPCLVNFVLLALEPSLYLGLIQIPLYIWATIRFFADRGMVQKLKKYHDE